MHKTLVLSGSIRAKERQGEFILEQAREASGLEDYTRRIREHQCSNPQISNSHILSGAAMMGAKSHGAEVDFFPMASLFPKREQRLIEQDDDSIDSELAIIDTLSIVPDKLEELELKVSEADGIVLVTPVYFGDRSSVANKFLQISGIKGWLKDKVFGCVSVGAKRNGGQETTVIYSILDALNQGAFTVGNGPPTSQYGGTAIGGKKGTVINDSWGLETAFGTGLKVAHASDVCKPDKNKSDKKTRITVLVTMDTSNRMLLKHLQDMLERASGKLDNIEFVLENVLEKTIYRCLGCDTCPSKVDLSEHDRDGRGYAKCVISSSDDDMDKLHRVLRDSDGIVIAGLSVKTHYELLYRYQALIERTRFIRRNDFELTDKLLTSFTLAEAGALGSAYFPMKTVTSYIRHNVIIHRPIEAIIHEEAIIEDGLEDLIHFARATSRMAAGRLEAGAPQTKYLATGEGGY